MRSRRGAAVVVVGGVLAMAGCSSDGDESEPGSTFTQPYLDETNVVEMRDAIEVNPPEGAGEDEMQVLEALGRSEASMENLLLGLPIEDSEIRKHAIGPYLDEAFRWSETSAEEERVMVGDPSEIYALSVDISDEAATVEYCLHQPGWVEHAAGEEPSERDPVILLAVTLQEEPDGWKSYEYTDASDDDVTRCDDILAQE